MCVHVCKRKLTTACFDFPFPNETLCSILFSIYFVIDSGNMVDQGKSRSIMSGRQNQNRSTVSQSELIALLCHNDVKKGWSGWQ